MIVYQIPGGEKKSARMSDPIVRELSELTGLPALMYNDAYEVHQCLYDKSFVVDGNSICFKFNEERLESDISTGQTRSQKVRSSDDLGGISLASERQVKAIALFLRLAVAKHKRIKLDKKEITQALRDQEIDVPDCEVMLNYLSDSVTITDKHSDTIINLEDYLRRLT